MASARKPANGPARRRTGRPPLISREVVVEAAVAVGFADLSVRRVAERLGVAPTALYHHVDNLRDLYVAAGEHVMAGLQLPRGAASATDYLQTLARSLRALERRHPGIGAFCAAGVPEATTTRATIAAGAEGLAQFFVDRTDATMLTAITANVAFSFAATERTESGSASTAADAMFEWVITNTTEALYTDRSNAPWNQPR